MGQPRTRSPAPVCVPFAFGVLDVRHLPHFLTTAPLVAPISEVQYCHSVDLRHHVTVSADSASVPGKDHNARNLPDSHQHRRKRSAHFYSDCRTPTSAYANAIDWDAIAQCESGGDWSINTGNGYFGGSNSNRRHGPSMAVEAILPTQLEPSRSSSPSVSSARKD